MPKQYTQYDFTRMKAGAQLGIATSPEENDVYAPFTRFVWYFQGLTFGKSEFAPDKKYIMVSAEGDVVYVLDQDVFERIPESGIQSPDSKYFGRMQDIQVIGDSLFACGDGLQFYKRERHGTWQCLAPDLRQPPSVPASAYCIMARNNGLTENEVYFVGQRGSIYFWDGANIRKIDCPVDSTLIDVHVESADLIWICGGDGTLLRGNHRTGFHLCANTGDDSLFQRMTMYDGTLYLAASAGDPKGLFTYRNSELARVNTGLTPEIANPHAVDSSHGVLWAMSLKDIVRFDGKTWERIDFPGHPPIR